MTSSTIKNLNQGGIGIPFDFCFAFCFFLTHGMSGTISCQARKREEEHDPPKPGTFIEIFLSQENQNLVEKIFAKRNKAFRDFLEKKTFF